MQDGEMGEHAQEAHVPATEDTHAAVDPGRVTENPTNGAQGGELYELVRALHAMRMGDFSVRMSPEFDRNHGQDRRRFQ